MARILLFLPNANAFLPCFQSSSSSSSTLLKSLHVQKQNVRTQPVKCNSQMNQDCSFLTKRSLCVSLTTGFLFSFTWKGCVDDANAAILEADDDEELLEKVKKDRKKRLEKQGALNSAAQETAYLQDLVYKLSRIGQAIEKNDLSTASSVLGDRDWVRKVKSAFNKLSSSPEEKSEVENF